MIYFKIPSIKLHYLLIISTLVIVSNSAPLQGDSEATILDYNNTSDEKGNYHFKYRTSNGITREETGTMVDVGLPNEHISVQGSYSYISLEGEEVTINYAADENGYTILTPSKIPPPPPSIVASPVPSAVLASLLGK